MSIGDIFLPLLYTVEHAAYDDTSRNDLGTVQDEWLTPETKDVYGWGPPQTTEPKEVIVGSDRYTVEIELMVPPGFKSKHKDHFTLDDEEIYTQVGPIENYEHNPFGWNPGSVINLSRVSIESNNED